MPRRNYNPRKGRRRAYSGSGQSGLLGQLQAELGNRPPTWQERREDERRNRSRNASTRQEPTR